MTTDEETILTDFLKSNSIEEIKLREAIINEDASQLFQKKCKEDLDINGMRLDLFFD